MFGSTKYALRESAVVIFDKTEHALGRSAEVTFGSTNHALGKSAVVTSGSAEHDRTAVVGLRPPSLGISGCAEHALCSATARW
jgi:hypothetical protein